MLTIEQSNAQTLDAVTDPLHSLDNVDNFIKKLDNAFEIHIRCMERFHQLLEIKGQLDQQYAVALHDLSNKFTILAKSTVNDRIKDIVLALGRNFKNFASNIEMMSYDLLTEANKGFDKSKDETAKELGTIKSFIKGA